MDWSRIACQSVSVRSVGRAYVCLTPTTSVAWRAGCVERGAAGRVDKSNVTQRPRGDRGQEAGWRAQPRDRDGCGVPD